METISQAAWVDRFATHLAALGMRAPRPQLELMALTLWPTNCDVRPEIAAINEYGLWAPDADAEAPPAARSQEELWRTVAEGISLNAECADHLVQATLSKIAEAAMRPSVLYRPTLRFDGSVWTAIYGTSPCVIGIGKTPREACDAFDAAWSSLGGRYDASER
jgi:hypothetical protein